jgi:AmiR/NasT family two-component response regulator
MPVRDGILTIVGLNKQRPELPVIAVCEHEQAAYLKLAVKFGTIAGFAKPVDPVDLVSAINVCRISAIKENS